LPGKKGTTVYDAIYIVFSKDKNLRLITADRSQAWAASEEEVKVTLVGTRG